METLQRKSPNEIFVSLYQCIILFPYIIALQCSISKWGVCFQIIEVLGKLKQVFVESKNSFKEKKTN